MTGRLCFHELFTSNHAVQNAADISVVLRGSSGAVSPAFHTIGIAPLCGINSINVWVFDLLENIKCYAILEFSFLISGTSEDYMMV